MTYITKELKCSHPQVESIKTEQITITDSIYCKCTVVFKSGSEMNMVGRNEQEAIDFTNSALKHIPLEPTPYPIKHRKWEYNTCIYKKDKCVMELSILLNRHGQEGWRLCAIDGDKYYFEKELN